jgi:DivIVA domain-containing protein
MAIQSDHEFAPTQIARAVFPTAFRGYDQDAVRRYLSRLAAALEHQQEYAGLGELEARTPAHERVEELELEIESLKDEIKDLELELVQRSVDEPGSPDGRPESEPQPEPEPEVESDFDEHRAIELLGKETARVLESARSAASDILKRAETQAASLKAQAKSELAEARKRADSLLTQKQAETEELVERMITEAESSAERVTTEADEHRAAVLEESSKILSEAEELSEAEQAEAEERAKQIVADAETLRQQVIAELVVERRDAQTELDRIAGARDRLAMSLAVARSELDEVADALVDSPSPRIEEGRSSKSDRSGSGDRPANDAAANNAAANNAVANDAAATVSGAGGDAVETEPNQLDLDAEVDGLIQSLDSDRQTAAIDDTSIPDGVEETEAADSAHAVGSEPTAEQTGTEPAAEAAPTTDGDSNNNRDSDNNRESKDGRDSERNNANLDSVKAGAAGKRAGRSGAKAGRKTKKRSKPAGAGVQSKRADEPEPVDELDDGEVEIITVNAVPEAGQELSLVEGFTTLEVGDLDRESVDPELDPPGSENPDPTALISTDGARPAGTEQIIDLTAEEGHGHDRPGSDPDPDSEPGSGSGSNSGGGDGEETDLVYSVLVNEPQSPDEVITTVASRVATAQRDRTRGDLLLDEAFTGRLPKPFSARDVALTRSGPNFRRQLRRALNDDQSDVLDRLRAGRGPIEVDELPSFGDQIDRYLTPLRRGLSEIAQAGARAGGQSDLSPAALDNLVRQLAKYIVDRVRVPTIRVVEENTENDRERILEPIRTLYRDFRNVGLPDLTEDALYEAFAIGLYDAIEPSAPVRWMTDPRSDPDPVCEINRARDDVAKGEVFPSGHSRPLSLPGCRCLVVVATY